MWVAENGQEVVVNLPLPSIPDSKNIKNKTSLLSAAANGQVMKVLLAKDGVDPDSKDKG